MDRGADGTLKVVSLTTDFGLADGYVGIVKGVILSICPQAAIIDLSHDVPPWNVAAAAWIVRNSYQYLPGKTVHICVVDPTVGSSRRAILVDRGDCMLLGPDNGILGWAAVPPVKVYELNNDEYWLKPLSDTFHARDIFAPVAAHLLSGVSPQDLGAPCDPKSVVRLPEPRLVNLKGWIDGEVVYEDRFGSLVTNIPATMARRNGTCILDGRRIGQLARTYSVKQDGAVAVVTGSHGFLEVAVYCGRASSILSAGVGSSVRVESA